MTKQPTQASWLDEPLPNPVDLQRVTEAAGMAQDERGESVRSVLPTEHSGVPVDSTVAEDRATRDRRSYNSLVEYLAGIR